jgi:hypothetical protein
MPQQTQGKQTQASQEPVQQSQDVLMVKISEQGSTHKLAQLFLGKQRLFPEIDMDISFGECTHWFSLTDRLHGSEQG